MTNTDRTRIPLPQFTINKAIYILYTLCIVTALFALLNPLTHANENTLYPSTNSQTPLSPLVSNSQTLIVEYPQVQDKHERDFDAYFLELLTLALDKSNIPYTLKPVTLPVMVESRSDKVLQQNHNMVHWLNSSSKREQHLTPIKVPLFKGLIGWRLLLIRKEDQGLFKSVSGIHDLAKYTAGQGHDWPDTNILLNNQLHVATSSSWEGLFEMLKLKRIDYFPRSVIEIERELRIFKHLDLYVDTHLALQYPAAYYFFVNKNNKLLASALARGLQQAVKDGDFDIAFNRFFNHILRVGRHSGKIRQS